MLRSTDLLMIPFSLLWGSFALYWEAAVITTNAPIFFVLWGIPFVLMGLYLIAGRFALDAHIRSHTTYAVTQERILIISGIYRRQIKSLNLHSLPELTLITGSTDAGSISFGTAASQWGSLRLTKWPGMGIQYAQFEAIPQVSTVYKIIRAAQHALST
jgi:hypothetical protein